MQNSTYIELVENKTDIFIFIAACAARTAEEIWTIGVVSRDVALSRYVGQRATAHASYVGQALQVGMRYFR